MKTKYLSLVMGIALAGAAAQSFAVSDAPEPPKKTASPAEDKARLDFNLGYEIFDKARKAEADAAKLSGAKKTKAMAAVLDQYKSARDKFVAAATGNPKMEQAWNHIGYTSRRLGEYNQSLDAYNKALEIKPKYVEAIEYRGETYLALNRIDDAKAAYMTLFTESRPVADELMKSMHVWVAERRKEPGSITKDQIDTFAKWLEERGDVAKQTASLGFGDKMSGPSWN